MCNLVQNLHPSLSFSELASFDEGFSERCPWVWVQPQKLKWSKQQRNTSQNKSSWPKTNKKARKVQKSKFREHLIELVTNSHFSWTSQVFPNGLLHFPNAVGAFLKGGFLRLGQRQHRHTLHPVGGQAAGNTEKDVALHAVKATHTGADGHNATWSAQVINEWYCEWLGERLGEWFGMVWCMVTSV